MEEKMEKEKNLTILAYLEYVVEYLYDHKFKGKEYFINDKLKYEGEYLFDKKWNGIEYNQEGNIISIINNGNKKNEIQTIGKEEFDLENDINSNGKRNSIIKEYDDYGELIFEGEYINEKDLKREKNIILIVI